jgi:hypothetical protein
VFVKLVGDALTEVFVPPLPRFSHGAINELLPPELLP